MSGKEFQETRKEAEAIFRKASQMARQPDGMFRAIEGWLEAAGKFRQIGASNDECFVLGNIGAAYLHIGDCFNAIEYLDRALNQARDLADLELEAITLKTIALVFQELSFYDESLNHFQQALAANRATGDRKSEGDTLLHMGIVYHEMDDLENAIWSYEEALTVREEIGDKSEVEAIRERVAIARERVTSKSDTSTTDQSEEVGHRDTQFADSLLIRASQYESSKEWEGANRCLKEALRIFRNLGKRRKEVAALMKLGLLHSFKWYISTSQTFVDGELLYKQCSLVYLHLALKICRLEGYTDLELITLTTIGGLFEERWGEKKSALRYYNEALQCAKRSDSMESVATLCQAIARLHNRTFAKNSANKYAIVDLSGTALTDFKYDSVEFQDGGIAKVWIGGKCGLCSIEGQELTPIKYRAIDCFHRGIAVVMQLYDPVEDSNFKLSEYSAGDIANWKSMRFGYIDLTGQEITPCHFEKANSFANGAITTAIILDWGIVQVDTDGTQILVGFGTTPSESIYFEDSLPKDK